MAFKNQLFEREGVLEIPLELNGLNIYFWSKFARIWHSGAASLARAETRGLWLVV